MEGLYKAQELIIKAIHDGDWEKVAKAGNIINEILLPPEGETRGDIGICSSCHAVLNADQIESFGESWCHVVAVEGRGGEPEPEPCGPVEVYYKHAEPTTSSEKALRDRIGVALDMALHFKVTDTTNDTIGSYQKWREETLDALLASSPAPSNKGAPDGHTS